MSNYFYDMLPKEEMEQHVYIPTVPEYLESIARRWADRPALSDDNVTLTYAEMCSRIARRRALLNSLGLKKGDKVAIFEKTSIDAVEMFLAATSAGYIGIMLPGQLPAPAVVGCCAKFGVSVLAIRDEFKEMAAGAPCKVISSSAMADEEAPVAKVDKEDPAAIFFTGGTTGAPKGAILPHRSLMRGTYNGVFAPGSQFWGYKLICFLPLSHVFGLIRSTMSTLMAGGHWYAAEDMKAAVGKIPVIRPEVLVLVPGLCEILLGLTKVYGPQFLGSVKTIIAGAAVVPPRLQVEFHKLGITLHAGYGMTEGANFTTANADVDKYPESVGKVYPGQETKVVDGELWIKGDNVFIGYYGQPEETAKTLTPDGWLKTGDLVRFDENGYMYIVGRIKNVIILPNGENVSPESIEEHFYRCPALRDCLVSEEMVDGAPVIAIDILPVPQAFEGKSDEEIYAFFKKLVDDVNATLPTTHRVAKMTIRKEDFKRTGSLKVSRNQK